MRETKLIYSSKAILLALSLTIGLNASEYNSSEVTKIELPEVPTPVEATKVITIGGNPPVKENKSYFERNRIIVKKGIPPVVEKKVAKDIMDDKVGGIINKRVSAYLQAPLMNLKSVKEKLIKAGFKILAIYKIDKKGLITSIVFTNDALTKQGDKENRGFATSIRVLIDKKNKQISISNPLYISKAFMQDDFKIDASKKALEALRLAFKNLKDSPEVLKYHLLPKYHFMTAMPFYKDMIEVASAKTTAELLAKLEKKKNKKSLLFIHKISKDRYLVGIKLHRRTTKFVKKIGYKNAGLLPYPILVENGKAKILDPKYYIALMYPKLTMSEFMTIASIPDAIEKDAKRRFK
ncbi:hypothetical protein MNB_SV-15-524 [hydrothermal vent metagenome]|uniref:Uncharacterized protein n=1 Tax=hydrothermal vent metagenome TaxID=652676 RepID=A0A1W1EJ40_9ZZZZ